MNRLIANGARLANIFAAVQFLIEDVRRKDLKYHEEVRHMQRLNPESCPLIHVSTRRPRCGLKPSRDQQMKH